MAKSGKFDKKRCFVPAGEYEYAYEYEYDAGSKDVLYF